MANMKLRLSLLVIAVTTFCAMKTSASELLWQSEFSTSDLETWQHLYSGPRFSGVNVPEAVTAEDGSLRISVEHINGENLTGMVSTRGIKEVLDGYLEIKVRVSSLRDGAKCSFLLQSPLFGKKDIDPELSPENTGSVITLFQQSSSNPQHNYNAVSWGDYGENSNREGGYSDVNIADGEFHSYGINLLEDGYEFYIDDKLQREVRDGISGVPMYLLASCEVKDSLGQFSANEEPVVFEIDYVHHYDKRPIRIIEPTGIQINSLEQWEVTKNSNIEYGDHSNDTGFAPSQPGDLESYKVVLEKDSHLGVDASFLLPKNVTEAWISYCVRFADNWVTQTGGKLPGFAGNSSGWFSGGGQGGKPSNGRNSWSARMIYGEFDAEQQSVPVGSYIYHTDQGEQGKYGDVDWWSLDPKRLFSKSAALNHNTWHSVKQHLKINSEGENDGLLEGWVDGELVYSRDDLNFSNASRHRKIYRFWLDVYHGGSEKSPSDQFIYFDQINYSIGTDTTSAYCT